MKSIIKIWEFFEDKIIRSVGAYILIAVTFFSFGELIRRYLFASSFFWYQDAIVYPTLAAVFLYFGITLKEDGHLDVSIVVDFMRKKAGRVKKISEIIEALGTFVGFAFCFLFVFFGIDFVRFGKEFGRTTESTSIPIWPFYLVLVIGVAFLGINFARLFYRQLKNLRGVKNNGSSLC